MIIYKISTQNKMSYCAIYGLNDFVPSMLNALYKSRAKFYNIQTCQEHIYDSLVTILDYIQNIINDTEFHTMYHPLISSDRFLDLNFVMNNASDRNVLMAINAIRAFFNDLRREDYDDYCSYMSDIIAVHLRLCFDKKDRLKASINNADVHQQSDNSDNSDTSDDENTSNDSVKSDNINDRSSSSDSDVDKNILMSDDSDFDSDVN